MVYFSGILRVCSDRMQRVLAPNVPKLASSMNSSSSKLDKLLFSLTRKMSDSKWSSILNKSLLFEVSGNVSEKRCSRNAKYKTCVKHSFLDCGRYFVDTSMVISGGSLIQLNQTTSDVLGVSEC